LAGIYLHIPFCRQACTYCNFHFTTSLRYRNDLVNALVQEIEQEQDYLGGESIQTIYFGGGTPSLLPLSDLERLLKAIRSRFGVAASAEITLEANPDDISEAVLTGWKQLGINRLSIGVQSFFEEELRWMNRAHNAMQAAEALQLACGHFENITMDLIYGSPLLTDEMWRQNVEKALSLNIPHLSCYALTVEEKTPLHKQIHLGQKKDVENDKQARQFLLLMQWLREKGYEHYEVSNFAKPGFRSRHNGAYWRGVPYLGLGPSAHSFNGSERRWNIANNSIYIQTVTAGAARRETERLTPTQALNEYIMISLRTAEGIDLDRVEAGWSSAARKTIEQQVMRYFNNGLVRFSGASIQLTDPGMLMADGIASDLFYEEPVQ